MRIPPLWHFPDYPSQCQDLGQDLGQVRRLGQVRLQRLDQVQAPFQLLSQIQVRLQRPGQTQNHLRRLGQVQIRLQRQDQSQTRFQRRVRIRVPFRDRRGQRRTSFWRRPGAMACTSIVRGEFYSSGKRV